MAEIAAAIRAGPGLSREVHLILENNGNQARYLERDAQGAPRVATAQWDDDVHHALHVLLSGEADGYYADYAAEPLKMLGRSLAEGFAYQGEYSTFRDRARGEPSAQLPPAAFVAFLQNHDMVGNRAFGERIQAFADPRLIPAAYACLLLSPQIPMLFMGEEFAASTPFLFFCDFGPELALSVSNGRRQEFKRFAAFADDAAVARIPDPNAESTFIGSKLRWQERLRAAASTSGWISSASYWRCGGTTWRRTSRAACARGVLRSSMTYCAWNGDWRTTGLGASWRILANMPCMQRCPKRGPRCFPWASHQPPRHRKPGWNRER